MNTDRHNHLGTYHNEKGVKKRKVTISQFQIDGKGEDLMLIYSTDKARAIYLKLLNENKKRLIGRVTRSTKTIYFKRKRDIHLFRKNSSYGFNYWILSNQSYMEWVDLSDDHKCHWKIPIKYILDNGKFLHFSSCGFEKQIFLTLDELEQFKIHEYENRRF
jgi:hypothetical protein